MKIPGIKDNTQYKAFVCKRCKEVYLAELKDGFFIMPEEKWNFLGEGTLCPECLRKFEELKKNFFNGK